MNGPNRSLVVALGLGLTLGLTCFAGVGRAAAQASDEGVAGSESGSSDDFWVGASTKHPAGDSQSWLSGYLMVFDYMEATRAMQEAGFLAHEDTTGRGSRPWFATDRAGLRLQLRAYKEVSTNVHIDTTFNIEYDVKQATRQPDSSLDDGISLYFKEGFISMERVLPFLDLKLGRQYIFWGRFEWGGAMDVVSGWDYNSMSAEKENYRMAVDSVRANWLLGPVTLETVLLPYFVPNRMALDLPDRVGPFAAIQNQATIPEASWENVELGARLTVPLGTQAEVALSAFRGFDRTFSMRTTAVMEEGAWLPTAIEFTPEYARQTLLGLDGEWAVGPVLLLFESGLFLGEDHKGDDIFRKNDQIKSVVGFEVEPHGRLMVQAQASYTHVLAYDRQREYETRKELGEPDPYVVGPNQAGFNYKIQWKALDDVTFHLLHMMTFPDSGTNDTMLLFFGSWEPYEAMKVYIGTVLFRGAQDTTFGRLEDQGRFFVEVRQFF